MGSHTQRGQVMMECLFALGFLALMIHLLSSHEFEKSKSIEAARIYKFQLYKQKSLR